MAIVIRQFGSCLKRYRSVPHLCYFHLSKAEQNAAAFGAKSEICIQKLNMSTSVNHQFQLNRTTLLICSVYRHQVILRYQSNNVASSHSPDIVPPVAPPELPAQSPTVATSDLPSQVNEAANGVSDSIASIASSVEPSLASQGLGGWSPVGILEQCFEYAHINLNMPWWLTIVVGTIIVRTLMFPLVIKAQRNAAQMNNHFPQMQFLQMKMMDARNSGNPLEAARCAHELTVFMKEHQINPLKSLFVPLVQAPVFISFFLALRGMANLPVESFKTGGLFWFENLTVADPYYLLPLITSATLFVTIEIGAEGGIRMENMQVMRYFLRALPVIIFPFTVNFPTAVLCYWVTTNAYSLCQVALLQIRPIRTYFNVSEVKKYDKAALPVKKKGFVDGMKEAFTNVKISRELEERQHFDNVRFTRSGMGPIPKTYPYDPTKQSATSVQTRKSDKH